LIWYLTVVASFAGAYYAITNYLPTTADKLAWYEALALSFYSFHSFHGRGFFQAPIHGLSDPTALLPGIEAIIGLFIELVFIATFSRRFLGN